MRAASVGPETGAMTLMGGARSAWSQAVVLARSPLLEPHAEKDRHRLGDPPLPRDPIPHRARGDSQSAGGAHLGEAQALQGGAQLLGGHRHGGAKIGTICSSLASRHIMPTLSGWPLLRCLVVPQIRRRSTSTGRFSCSRNSRTTCASRPPAYWGAMIGLAWSSQRGAGCSSPRSRWEPRRSARVGVGFGVGCRLEGSCVGPWSWSPSGWHLWFGRSGDSCGVFCTSFSCGRSGYNAPFELKGASEHGRIPSGHYANG
jgi:hypothetical protein